MKFDTVSGLTGFKTEIKFIKGRIAFFTYAYRLPNAKERKKTKKTYLSKMLLIKSFEKRDTDKKTLDMFRGGNILFNNYGGYRVSFPGMPIKNYYRIDKRIEKLYPFERINGMFGMFVGFVRDYDKLEKLDPSLKYLAQKLEEIDQPISLELISNYRKYGSKIEFLILTKNPSLATSPAFLKKSPAKKKEIINYIKQHGVENESIGNIEFAIKNNINVTDISFFKRLKTVYKERHRKVFDFIRKKNIDSTKYQDYYTMAIKLNKNLDDDYWLLPSNIDERHDLLMEQLKLIEEEETFEQNSKIAKISEKIEAEIIGNYNIFVPTNIAQIKEQANALSQCLITSNYHKQMGNGKLILVFINQNEVPKFTAEIKKSDNKIYIGQFYGDERDRKNMNPPEDVKILMNDWLEKHEKSLKQAFKTRSK